MKLIQLAVAATAALGISGAMAADEIVKGKIEAGITAGKTSSRDRIGDDIALYFGSQKTPAVEKRIGDWDSSQTSRNCETAFASAIIRLQNRARNEGGNAIINITSGAGDSSDTDFTCTAGRMLKRVRLKGTVVKLKQK